MAACIRSKLLNHKENCVIIMIILVQNKCDEQEGMFMTLSQAIIYYILVFIMTTVFIICGCLIGAALRKRKNARLANENKIKDSSLN